MWFCPGSERAPNTNSTQQSIFMLFPIALTAACLVSVLVLLAVDRREFQPGRVIAKLTASTCFVLVAFSLGAHRSTYGQLILGALVLGWMGDAFLLSRAPKAFMGGLAAFLLSHVLFAVAFLSGVLSSQAMGVAAVVVAVFGAGVLRWLLPHTPKEFKAPVLAYVVVIVCIFCALRFCHRLVRQCPQLFVRDNPSKAIRGAGLIEILFKPRQVVIAYEP